MNLSHRTITASNGKSITLEFDEAHALAEQIYTVSVQRVRQQVAAFGWIVCFELGAIMISKQDFRARMTAARAQSLGIELSRIRRQELRIVKG